MKFIYFSISWIVLDEADKLFEEGKKSFREQFDLIYAACTNQYRKVALFSATWTSSVSKWTRKYCKGIVTVSVGQRNSATDLIDQQLLFAGSEPGKMLAFRELLRTGLQPPVLVFVDSKVSLQSVHYFVFDVIFIFFIGSCSTTI